MMMYSLGIYRNGSSSRETACIEYKFRVISAKMKKTMNHDDDKIIVFDVISYSFKVVCLAKIFLYPLELKIQRYFFSNCGYTVLFLSLICKFISLFDLFIIAV